jgi:hypothetical protein
MTGADWSPLPPTDDASTTAAQPTEVLAGSIPSVPTSGIVIVESTAEGEDGVFHDMTKRAEELRQKRVPLSRKDYRLHFFGLPIFRQYQNLETLKAFH